MAEYRFHLGRLGALRALPDRYGDVDVPSARLGGSRESLSGRLTLDVRGFRRGPWAWTWPQLTAAQAAYVDALLQGLVPGPLRLLDTRASNRLPAQVAAGGSQRHSGDGIAATTGTTDWRPLSAVPALDATLPAAAGLRGAYRWDLTLPGGGQLYPSGNSADGRWRTPVLPGETLRLMISGTGPAATPARLDWREYDATGAYTDRQGPAATLTASAWTQFSTLATMAPGTVAVAAWLTVLPAAASGTVYATAWSIGDPTVEDLPPGMVVRDPDGDPFGGWRPGGGAPVVALAGDGGAHGYSLPGLHNVALTLVETQGRRP